MFGIPDHAQPSDVSFDLFATAALPNDKREAVSAGDSVEHETKMSFAPERNKGGPATVSTCGISRPLTQAATPKCTWCSSDTTEKGSRRGPPQPRPGRKEEARHVIANLRKES